MNIRVLTAAALFDGHDVSINIFRRLLQKRGAEVINIGHNRSVDEVVAAAVQEDVDALLISSYQGGHNEYFKYLIDSLKSYGAENKLVFGGGGGVILPKEIKILEDYGVTKIYHAEDGIKVGIDGIADDIIDRITTNKHEQIIRVEYDNNISVQTTENKYSISKMLSCAENHCEESYFDDIRHKIHSEDKNRTFVMGVTGTGGAGKSSLIDEIVGRFLAYTKGFRIAVLAVDPSKSRTKGALLGDRIRYNHIYNDRVYFRSFATRESGSEISNAINDAISIFKAASYDLIIVETSGIGQGDSKILSISDKSLYVMTSEFGAPSQLEKIDMLEEADFIAINKFEKVGSEDVLREVKINYIRNHSVAVDHSIALDDVLLPVYAVRSNEFNNTGVNRLFKDIFRTMMAFTGYAYDYQKDLYDLLDVSIKQNRGLITEERQHYLAEIGETIKSYQQSTDELATKVDKLEALYKVKQINIASEEIDNQISILENDIENQDLKYLMHQDIIKNKYAQEYLEYDIQGKTYKLNLLNTSITGLKIPKIVPPDYSSWADLIRYKYLENFPGEFPYTAGVFPFKRTTEDPKRQFAGEGSPERTNKRFHYLCEGEDAKRLSVAFDGITLYAEDPAEKPDIYGKIGESGVSICTIEDMDTLLKGFDLMDPLTSVSMTINAPAPIMVAFFFMTAYQRELKKLEGSGQTLSNDQSERLKLDTFRKLRGTVQADMLKEDQGQNTIIFSIDFAMKMIGDLQEYLSKNQIKNYYSLSISGYHIAEAGANPITQLAFTLANGFTYVEYFLSRGLNIDDFAPNLSFFFSNGMDPEYSVIGRVARRIWAIALRDKYGANARSQKLKYHIQTSGRSLHAQEIEFNDIRTTLQGLIAFYDNCNSLHTNSYDEAVTTPTEESVRRSMAIQQILTKEFGMLKNENPIQGSFFIKWLTDEVEKAVLEEFSRLSRRGGVLGAMETQYQRSKIQEESLHYESLKHSGAYPIIGVNTFLNPNTKDNYENMQVIRADATEKNKRLEEIKLFKSKNVNKAPQALENLRKVALNGGNIFEELLNTVQYATMGEISNLLYEIGGKYRRGM